MDNPYKQIKKPRNKNTTMENQESSYSRGFNLPYEAAESNAIEEAVAANASASTLLAMLGAPPTEFGATTSGWIGLPPSITPPQPSAAPVPPQPSAAPVPQAVSATVDSSSPSPIKVTRSKVTHCLRNVVAGDLFPKINDQGKIYLVKKGLHGQQAKKASQTLSELEVEQHIEKWFASHPYYDIANPEIRALSCKGQGTWTAETIREASDCFYVPAGLRVAIIWPDLFDRDVLKNHELFKTQAGGVLTPCPFCRSNKFVKLLSFNVQKYQRRARRAVHVDGCNIPMIGPIMSCSSEKCVGKMPSTEKAKASWNRTDERVREHSFLVWSKSCFEMYPLEVRRKYKAVASGIGTNNDKHTIATQALSMELLDDRNTFANVAARLWRHFEIVWLQARDRFTDFVIAHGRDPITRSDLRQGFFVSGGGGARTEDAARAVPAWPDLSEDVFAGENAPPKENAIEALFYIEYNIVKPFLLRDLFSRLPTPFISWDATFEIAGRTMTDILADGGTQKAIAIIYDQYGRVLTYGFIDSEKPLHWKRLMYFLRQRCERRGPQHANVVRYGGSDLCCENCNDRSAHWFVESWPKATEAPFRDIFHAIKMVTGPKSVRGTSHDLHANFCRELSSQVLLFEEESIGKAIDLYRQENPEVWRDRARKEVLRDAKWRKKMYNYTTPITLAVRGCRELWNELEVADQRMRSEAEATGHKYQSYILSPIPGKRRGGNWELENFIRHLEKGCCRDYFPPREMSYPMQPVVQGSNKLVDLGRLRSTGGGESTNKQVNRASNNATRLSAELSDAKILLRITRLNLDKDRRLEHITGEKARSPHWYRHEEIEKRQQCDHVLSPSTSPIVYPTELEHGYDEPIGIEFARHKNWESVDRALHFAVSGGTNPTACPPIQAAIISALAKNKEHGFSAGNTTWNRKEGGTARRPLQKFAVKERLTSVQESVFVEIVLNVHRYHDATANTIASFAQKVVELWNREHYNRMMRGEPGLGGVLPDEIARSRIVAMSDIAVASTAGPKSYEPIFFSQPSSHPPRP